MTEGDVVLTPLPQADGRTKPNTCSATKSSEENAIRGH